MNLGWNALEQLSKEAGESFYLLDLQRLRQNYTDFRGAFRVHYPKTQLAYSYKTNYTPRICAFADAQGGYAEVVSGMEYELARRVGVRPERIIFNGPCKGREELERAVAEGAQVNLDSLREVQLVEAFAAAHPDLPMRLGVRCNFPIGEPTISRFGFDVFGDDFRAAFKRLGRNRNTRVGGLHCHFSSRARRPESFALRTRTLLELAASYFPDKKMEFINLGGGFFSRMSNVLQQQLGMSVPTWEQYGEAVAQQVAKAFPEQGPELILEPGSALVSDVFTFVARIVELKKVRSRIMALCLGSIHNIKPTLHSKNMPMEVVRGNTQPECPKAVVDVVGYTCMEHDCLHAGYQGQVAPGDFAVFPNVGAYTVVMKPPFIRGAPPIIAPDNTGGLEWVRRAERVDDVFSAYGFGSEPLK